MTDDSSIENVLPEILGLEKIENKNDLFNSEIFKIVKNRVEQRNIKTFKKENTGSAGKCKKCGSLNTISNAVQTRSGDEGMTIFIYCCNCGFNHKEH